MLLSPSGVDDGEVSVVASQVRGYGVWDGGVALGGSVLDGWKGPAPSLLFLWVSDAQANLLQKELSTIQTPTPISASGKHRVKLSFNTQNQAAVCPAHTH